MNAGDRIIARKVNITMNAEENYKCWQKIIAGWEIIVINAGWEIIVINAGWEIIVMFVIGGGWGL